MKELFIKARANVIVAMATLVYLCTSLRYRLKFGLIRGVQCVYGSQGSLL